MDTENNPAEQVAPANDGTQSEQVAAPKEVAETPETASDKVEEKLYADKFKSVEDLEKSYKELQSSFTRERQAMASQRMQAPEPANVPYDLPQLDPDSALAVDRLIEEKWEAKKAAEFERKHKDELKDPILAGTTSRLIREANLRGEILDQEEALTQAKKMLDERVKPQIKEAQAQGVEQGEDIAKKKGQLGAVGESGPRPEVDLDKLTAEEYAKYLNLPRAQM